MPYLLLTIMSVISAFLLATNANTVAISKSVSPVLPSLNTNHPLRHALNVEKNVPPAWIVVNARHAFLLTPDILQGKDVFLVINLPVGIVIRMINPCATSAFKGTIWTIQHA